MWGYGSYERQRAALHLRNELIYCLTGRYQKGIHASTTLVRRFRS